MIGELEKIRKELKDAKKLLTAIANISETKATSAATEMNAGDVPRGRYGYLQGQLDISNDILDLLNISRVEVRKSGKRVFSGMFRGLKL